MDITDQNLTDACIGFSLSKYYDIIPLGFGRRSFGIYTIGQILTAVCLLYGKSASIQTHYSGCSENRAIFITPEIIGAVSPPALKLRSEREET
jgi:hypothetical protein